MIIGPIYAFVLGSIVGSFLNVLVIRYGTGVGILGRSKCMSCLRQLSFLDLVPIFSFLFLKGRCRTCKVKLSPQYLIVEFITAILFLLAYFVTDIERGWISVWSLALLWIFSAILVAIAVYDFKHKIIPDGLVYALAGVGLFKVLLTMWIYSMDFWSVISWNMLLSGPFFFAMPFALIWVISHGRWIGFGDAKLALGLGWFLGFDKGMMMVAGAFWIGAIVGVLLILAYKIIKKLGLKSVFSGLHMKSEIPFAPFMIFAFFLVVFLDFGISDFLRALELVLPVFP